MNKNIFLICTCAILMNRAEAKSFASKIKSAAVSTTTKAKSTVLHSAIKAKNLAEDVKKEGLQAQVKKAGSAAVSTVIKAKNLAEDVKEVPNQQVEKAFTYYKSVKKAQDLKRDWERE